MFLRGSGQPAPPGTRCRGERGQLSGIVEIDESLVGGVDQGGKRGRGADKAIIVIAVEIKEPKGFGRIRMCHTPDVSSNELIPFICDVLTPKVYCTNRWLGWL